MIIWFRSRGLNGKRLQTTHSNEFASWFEKYIEVKRKNEVIDPKVCCLSSGPIRILRSYKGYTINGVKFRTTEISDRLKTQNNGVFVSATTCIYSRGQDEQEKNADLTYYGVVENIYELLYGHLLEIPLFECKWFDIGKLGRRIDEFGLLSINTSRRTHVDEPFVMASQAQQCFYVQDPTEPVWSFVLKRPQRDLFNLDDDVE